jgi:hypothetical protein
VRRGRAANALALRGAIPLRESGPPRVPHSELLALVAAALLDDGAGANAAAAGASSAPSPRALDANAQQNVSDAVTALPKLATVRACTHGSSAAARARLC